MTIEEKLRTLYELQKIDSQVNEIQILKGELPVEVSDLEDDIAGMETRAKRLEKDIKDTEQQITRHKVAIKDAESLIVRYEQQQQNVKNNREFDALGKEIELQQLDIQIANKRIKEAKVIIDSKQEGLDVIKKSIAGRQKELDLKREELKDIIEKTEKQELDLIAKADKVRKRVEERLLIAYDRTRGSFRNGLSVSTIERNACSGCFNLIPPQRQQEIRQRKKIILCEHCGRILVDDEIAVINN